MRRTFAIAWPLLLSAAFLAAQTSSEGDQGWPTEVSSNGNQIVIYQPQADSWKGNHLEARSAVTVTPSGSSKALYGIVTLSARTDVDKENRLVDLEDLKVTSASFPAASAQQSELLKTIRESLSQWPETLSLDRLMADLSITDAEMNTESVQLKNTPPRIIFSDRPSVLIVIDGQPFYHSVAGTPYTRVMNTPALLLYDSKAGHFFLDGNTRWMTASNLNGPWSPLPNPPASLNSAKQQIQASEQKDPHDHSKDPGVPDPNAPPPAVFVSTSPAELVQTHGAPQYSPVANTNLVYATNTDNDLFMDVKNQDYYVLLAGRWYQAKAVNGPWTFVSGKQLPGDFKKIPPDGPKARVLASIPGTQQAKEAAVADQIPQTATVDRKTAKLNVSYDGNPQFKPIDGTNMQYAANSGDDVIQASGRYYSVHDAVWFVSDSPYGPWTVADSIPPEIYSMPPSSPLYHDRYVYVYGATPDYVYEGYTPGYLGAYYSDGVVVFGTGWDYPGWYGGSYYGWPWTWGFGWNFSYWGGGWFTRPAGDWWYHNPPYMSRVYYNHFNPHWQPRDWEGFRNNVNVYHRWGQNAVLGRNATRTIAARNAYRAASTARYNPRYAGNLGNREDLYAGRNGGVYQHRQNGWFQRSSGATWNRVQPQRGLEMQRQSRSFGTSRLNEFRGFGGFSGLSRQPGGFSSMPRTSFGGGFSRGGGFARPAGGFGGGRGGGGFRR